MTTTSTTETAPPPQPPPPKRASRALSALLVGVALGIPAAALSLLSLIDIEADLALMTAVCTSVTSFVMVLASALGGTWKRPETAVHVAMSAALGAMLVAGFPLFVALEPVWWRFAAGLVPAIFVVTAVAYGAPVAARQQGPAVRPVVMAWLREPVRFLGDVFSAFIGREEARR